MAGTLAAAIRTLDRNLKAAWRREMRATGVDVRGELTDIVRSWEHKPTFMSEYTEYPHLIVVDISPSGRYKKIWEYVDQGTGEHGKAGVGYLIVPKQPDGMLRFQTGYSARTAPVAKANVGTGQSFGDWVSAQQVYHPGIEPRLFSNTIAQELKPPLVTRINNATRRAV